MQTNGQHKGRVHIGVGGGIAAFKVVQLASSLVKSGYAVHVGMTPSAQAFVGPLSFQAVTGNAVFTSLTDPGQEGDIGHISFAQDCDILVIAPATANLLAKAALGLGDDVVSTAMLAADKPIFFVPAMNTQMWQNPATQNHIETLLSRGHRVLEPASGRLACGAVGAGRLPEPAEIHRALEETLNPNIDLVDLKILVVGGPTREYLDPVRFLSNPSSGKTAFALCHAARDRGAQVRLILGPVPHLDERTAGYRRDVVSAQEMYDAVFEELPQADVVIMCAAVSDWTPSTPLKHKEKKSGDTKSIELKRTHDILHALGHHESRRKYTLVGFAAETENVIENAKQKRVVKHTDLIVANDVSRELGFESDENVITLVAPDGEKVLNQAPKYALAHEILDEVLSLRAGR